MKKRGFFIDDSVYSDSRFVGRMRGRERTR